MAYSKLIKEITSVIQIKFQTISANYNFDYGDEFEIALCDFFELILPEKYGICRGFAVTKDDQIAGDDIIIYDKERFHRLRLVEKNKYDKKIEVPFEAVYAYFEAKHKLTNDNLKKALTQIENFKNLKREPRKMLSIDHNIGLGSLFKIDERPKWPEIANPFYSGLISKETDLDESNFWDKEISKINSTINAPDTIIAGSNTLIQTEVIESESEHNDSPFYLKDQNPLKLYKKQDNAFAIGIIQFLYALDTIRLGKMPFGRMIMEALKK